MRNTFLAAIVISFALSAPTASRSQSAAPATYVTSAEVLAIAQKTASLPVSDQAIRIINVNNEYNVAVGVVHRAKTVGQPLPNGISHSQITEIYHVIEGRGTLVTGGTLENPEPAPADSPTVALLNGPSTRGGAIRNGASQEIGPGDIVVIPPNTPHWFSNVATDEIVYLILRMDPKKVLPAGYMPPN
jgi:mannose-6-phosphate isomerase-like protein (cupin superfamily)